MEKEFFDVFPNLKLKQELSELLEEVIVTKVACNSAKTCVRVYLCPDLPEKRPLDPQKAYFQPGRADSETVLSWS